MISLAIDIAWNFILSFTQKKKKKNQIWVVFAQKVIHLTFYIFGSYNDREREDMDFESIGNIKKYQLVKL